MILRDHLAQQGNWLFRHRSFLPLLLLPLAIVALPDSGSLDGLFGDGVEDACEIISLVISLAGLALRCATVGFVPGGTSGRNTRSQRAEFLNTTGFYSLMRHPLYVGNFLMIIGIALNTKALWFTAIVAVAFWIYYERIMMAEEAFLSEKFGDSYRRWAERTPVLMIRPSRWQAPVLPFSWRTVLRREYNGLLLICLSFGVWNLIEDIFFENDAEPDPGWLLVIAFGVVAFLVLRGLKKRTRLLDVAGR